ncbi:MAG: Flp pilus assembly complex ATPase component TadA [Lentisphaeria bacterium]|nr:Flp pilus assembly complex ATPase component TadA [Lentisphaeria bacterium]
MEKLTGKLKKNFPEYAGLLTEMSPAEADCVLLEKGRIGEFELLALYSEIMYLPVVDEKSFATQEKIEGFSADYLAAHSVLPLELTADALVLAVADPYELDQIGYPAEELFGCPVKFQLMRRNFIDRQISRLYFDEKESAGGEELSDESELRRLAGETGIVRLVNELLLQAVEQRASDIHIEPEESELVIRFRVDGVLNDHMRLPFSDYPAIASRIKLVGGLNIAERRLPQDGRTNFQLGDYELDIRISTIPVMRGESIVLRLLARDSMRFDLRELGMDDQLRSRFEQLIAMPHGIILVVGPTGSGKTTTLYSVMQQLNDRHRKIITIEDPVEYQLPGLSQMQVNPKIGLTFANGLRSIVRQDPDVILVGEIRDRETADIAINAALTGHLVLSTLHTNDAVGAVVRLIDMGVEPFLITASLCGVLSQRLVRRLCRSCGGEGRKDGARCEDCAGSGFHGRSGIFELLMMDEDLREAIRRRASNDEIEALARAHGMITLYDDGMKKVERGETTRSEVIRSASGLAAAAEN